MVSIPALAFYPPKLHPSHPLMMATTVENSKGKAGQAVSIAFPGWTSLKFTQQERLIRKNDES